MRLAPRDRVGHPADDCGPATPRGRARRPARRRHRLGRPPARGPRGEWRIRLAASPTSGFSYRAVAPRTSRSASPYCLVWPDDENGAGELEPVGVRPEFRRRGLGAAVCTYALRRWYDEGGRGAIVYCQSRPACALYEAIGFRRHATLIGYARP